METFLEANYPLRDQNGNRENLHIKIYKPEKDPESEHGDYFCSYEIKGQQLEKQSKAFGVDPLQALWLTLKIIRQGIHEYEYQYNMRSEYFFDAGSS